MLKTESDNFSDYLAWRTFLFREFHQFQQSMDHVLQMCADLIVVRFSGAPPHPLNLLPLTSSACVMFPLLHASHPPTDTISDFSKQ